MDRKKILTITLICLIFSITSAFIPTQQAFEKMDRKGIYSSLPGKQKLELSNNRGPVYGLMIEHNTKMNEKIINESISLIKIPSKKIQFNVTFSNVSKGDSIDFMITNPQKWQLTPNITYYNFTTYVYIFGLIDNQVYTDIYVTNNFQDPTKIDDYFFTYLNNLLSLLKTQSISTSQLISGFGKDSLITFTIDNGTEFFPTIGPDKPEYYSGIREQQKNYAQTLSSFNNGKTLNVSSKIMWRTVPLEKDDVSEVPPQTALAYYNNSIYVSTTTSDYDLKVNTTQALQFEKNILGFLVFHNHIRYFDKKHNTTLEISNFWNFQRIKPSIAGKDNNSPTKKVSFPLYSSIIGLLVIIIPVALRKNSTHKKIRASQIKK